MPVDTTKTVEEDITEQPMEKPMERIPSDEFEEIDDDDECLDGEWMDLEDDDQIEMFERLQVTAVTTIKIIFNVSLNIFFISGNVVDEY